MRAVVEAVVTVAVLAAAGLGGGWLWHHWWAPAPPGVVGIPAEGGPQRWFPMPYEAGERAVFAATGEYVVVAAGLGVLIGLVAALVARRSAAVTLVALLVGSALAAWLMLRLGVSLGPPDPDPLARTLQPGDPLPGSLDVAGWTAYLAWPFGALLGFGVTLGVEHLVGGMRSRADDPDWLAAQQRPRHQVDADPRATRTRPPPPPSVS